MHFNLLDLNACAFLYNYIKYNYFYIIINLMYLFFWHPFALMYNIISVIYDEADFI